MAHDGSERIPVAADHAGFELKEHVAGVLRALGFEVEDLGTRSSDSTDYADYAHPLAEQVASGTVQRGVLMCGTGLGMSYAANRHGGVRAAVAWSAEIAELARRHNDANVLVLPARFISHVEAEEIVRRWLDTPFDGGRHESRVRKIELDRAGAVRAADAVMAPAVAQDAVRTATPGDGRADVPHRRMDHRTQP